MRRLILVLMLKMVLLGLNFDFFGFTAHYLVGTGGYCSLPGGYWWLLLVAGGYFLLLLITAHSHFQYEQATTPFLDHVLPTSKRSIYPQVGQVSISRFMTKILSWNLVCITSHAWIPPTPATEYATIIEVMNRALKTKESLKLSEIVCVFELCIFVKAAEIMEGSF